MAESLRPLFDYIVVKEVQPPDLRRSGLALPAGTRDEQPPQEGIVIAAGEGQDWWEHVGITMPVKPGDHVMFPPQAGTYIEINEEKLLVMRVVQLLGILE